MNNSDCDYFIMGEFYIFHFKTMAACFKMILLFINYYPCGSFLSISEEVFLYIYMLKPNVNVRDCN
jgi:hypothetical protein